MEDTSGPEVNNFRNYVETDTSGIRHLVFESEIKDDYKLQYSFFSLTPNSVENTEGHIPLDYTRFKRLGGTSVSMYLDFPLYDTVSTGLYDYRLDVTDIQNRTVSVDGTVEVE